MSSAVISPCGTYRYLLTRITEGHAVRQQTACFIMLNPSTADATLDDPTIRRCKGFAMDWGCTALTVVNLFAYRATDPKVLGTMHVQKAIGPENDDYILRAATAAQRSKGPVVCAWGVHGPYEDRDCDVMNMLERHGVSLTCLGLTKGGHPKHPLYLKSDLKPQPY